MRTMTRLGAALAVATACLLLPRASHAQKGSGRLVGLVVDSRSGTGVARALIVQLGDGRSTTADSIGLFHFDSLPQGIVRFMVRAQGFRSTPINVALTVGEYMERRVELDSAGPEGVTPTTPTAGQKLPAVDVVAAPSLGPRFADFERRQKTGAGFYITRAAIEKGEYGTLQDVARSVRGVTVECGGGRGCFIRMTRAPMQCAPEYVVDNNVDNMFGPTTPVRDIEALEIYTGPSNVPGEYAGRNAGCGVIVIWTKSGPTRRKKGNSSLSSAWLSNNVTGALSM